MKPSSITPNLSSTNPLSFPSPAPRVPHCTRCIPGGFVYDPPSDSWICSSCDHVYAPKPPKSDPPVSSPESSAKAVPVSVPEVVAVPIPVPLSVPSPPVSSPVPYSKPAKRPSPGARAPYPTRAKFALTRDQALDIQSRIAEGDKWRFIAEELGVKDYVLRAAVKRALKPSL